MCINKKKKEYWTWTRRAGWNPGVVTHSARRTWVGSLTSPSFRLLMCKMSSYSTHIFYGLLGSLSKSAFKHSSKSLVCGRHPIDVCVCHLKVPPMMEPNRKIPHTSSHLKSVQGGQEHLRVGAPGNVVKPTCHCVKRWFIGVKHLFIFLTRMLIK